MIRQRRHFDTFDALRFLAFFKVFLLHLPILAFPWFNYLRAGGGVGVQFFFVLSGFLITYILMDEKEHAGKVNLKNFFVRRIFRIWPLYFLMLFVAYATPYILSNFLHLSSSNDGYVPKLIYSALFLENYRMMYTHNHANVSPLSVMWSLCIEEHFYIVWGIVAYFMSTRNILYFLLTSVFTGILARWLYAANNIPSLDLLTNIDLFAFGGIAAYFMVYKPILSGKFSDRFSIQGKKLYVLLLITIVVVFSQYADNDYSFIWMTTLLGLGFSLLVFFCVEGKERLIITDTNILSRLGIYTYGLYLYHTLIINLLKQVFAKLNWGLDSSWYAIVFIIGSAVLTIICSIGSYYLFEKPFLRLKKYFR